VSSEVVPDLSTTLRLGLPLGQGLFWDQALDLGTGAIVFSMKVDKGQFDEVLRRMLEKAPQKTSEIKAPKKRPKPSPK
jgi:hypothetical protein